MIGSIVNDRYRIDSEVGAGGMAEVFKAYDLVEKRYVALKVIKKEYCLDPRYVRRFEREAQTVLSLRCKNIVCAYDFGVYNDRNYIVLEYVEGCTLKEYLGKHGAMNPKTAVKITCRVLDALEYAHNAGYIHRDVKPQNVMISADKTIKLTDFGIAKDSESATKTYDGSNVIGSVHYISPEQAKGETVGTASDLYSVGIMLYEMLIGKPPFEGENSVQIALKHINESITPPSSIETGTPPALNDVIIKATSKDARQRYSSAEEMKGDLLRAMAQPKKHFIYIDDMEGTQEELDRANADSSRKHSAKLWHVVMPVVMMLVAVIGVFVLWYVLVFNDPSDDGISRVPDLLGRSIEEATNVAKNREFEITVVGTAESDVYGEGTVCRQSPVSGSSYEKGSIIEVWLSSGSSTNVLVMPNLVGSTLEEALILLEGVGMSIDTVTYSISDAPEGTIIWQSIVADDDAVEGDAISVEISGTLGVTLIPMPDLVHFSTPNRLRSILALYGITDYWFRYVDLPAGVDTYSLNGTIASQSPTAQIPVVPSTTHVDIYIYADLSGAAYADFSHGLVIDSDFTAVTVTVLTDIGEVVVYETELNAGTQNLEFTAAYRYSGEYTCIIYINGVESLRMSKTFVR